MGCLSEVLAAVNSSDFQCRPDVQSYLIEFMLNYCNYDLQSLAEVLEINPYLLVEVLNGKYYLSQEKSKELVKWFLIFISQ